MNNFLYGIVRGGGITASSSPRRFVSLSSHSCHISIHQHHFQECHIQNTRCHTIINFHYPRYFLSTASTTARVDSANTNCILAETTPRRLSVAIVGAGPSGFYVAKYLSLAMRKKMIYTNGTNNNATSLPLSEIVVKEVEEEEEEEEEQIMMHNKNDLLTTSNNNNFFHFHGVDIDLLERLPTPYGLVRYGVAPDHPEVKNVEKEFASLFVEQREEDSEVEAKTSMIKKEEEKEKTTTYGTNTLAYFGNVDVGHDISLSQLQNLYDIVVLAYGCQSSDRTLGIPGEAELEGVLSAREFVAWYNGHPEYGHIGQIVNKCLWPSPSPSLSPSSSKVLEKKEEDEENLYYKSTRCVFHCEENKTISKARVVVIGQGNVALDVARILSKGAPGLWHTDTPTSVLQILKGGVSHVSIVGRRGHVQGAFTIKEVRELTKLYEDGYDVAFHVRKEELDLGMTESSLSELKGPTGRPKTRQVKLLQEAAESTNSNASKQLELRFLMNPTRFESDDVVKDRVGRVVCERTNLVGDPFQQQPVGTNTIEELPADLVLVSIGYKGMQLDGMNELQIFDDQKGVIKNVLGKVTGENNLFVAGWIKRGPLGIIGTNIMDAKETVASIMKFVESGEMNRIQTNETTKDRGRIALIDVLDRKGVVPISWRQFQNIDAAECDHSRLRSDGQPREKITSIKALLETALRD